MKSIIVAIALTGCVATAEQETLPPLVDGRAPQTFDEMWAGFDPRAEPLETEVLRQWQEDGVLLQVIRYRIGIFKGQKAMMAAVYGRPKGEAKLPGLVQIHGGGQYADYRAPLYNAKRGYATISVSWAGRINAPGYQVTPDVVQLFWDGKTDDPAYKVTTDWGVLDAYHAPCRNPKNGFHNMAPQPWTLDAVESPRNNPWFLCTLGARRALTFLEQQSEVDPDRLGVYGHSMGGKLTVMTAAADSRVKAAAPSCGGVSDRNSGNAAYRTTIGDDVNLKRVSCPIMFLNPANDFHGRIDDLQLAVRETAGPDWRATCSPHHNHQDTAEYQVLGPLWLDQHLKGTFTFPRTPVSSLELTTQDGVPTFTVGPDGSMDIVSVDIYYTQQGRSGDAPEPMDNAINRFWHHAAPQRHGDVWAARMPLSATDRPLWAYANVTYSTSESVVGAGYYYAPYAAEQFVLSSTMHIATPAELRATGLKAALEPSLLIEEFGRDWEREWFTYDLSDNWARRTHKLYNELWRAPSNAKLAIEVRAAQPNTLVIGIDTYAAEAPVTGGPAWQRLLLSPADLCDASGAALSSWTGIKELRLGPRETLRSAGGDEHRNIGGDWQGSAPQFRNLRWVVE